MRTDIVIVGAGVLGIYQLYTATKAGYQVRLLEQGDGVGGTWYWNRYPGCRFDSESYTYGYLFSRELWQEWDWSEEFAGQPETERYLNYVVDKFGLREHIRFGATVTSAGWDQESWTVKTADGFEIQSRYLISATGVLSVPQFPDVPGREDFAGEAYHPGRWPREPVDFKGKRVAVVGTGSSGVQIAPEIADEVESLTVYQRTPTWATPLNNHPITADQQAYLKANFEPIRAKLDVSVSGFLHKPHDRKTFEDTEEQRRAFYETIWSAPGFAKLTANYKDLLFDKAANQQWCDFLEEKIRGIVKDPATADMLVPKDHLYGGLRPPYVTGYYEMFNKRNVSLRATPIVKVTETGIETSDGLREFDMIIWATGFDFGTGALARMGIVGTGGLKLNDYWADGPLTYLGIMTHGFPNLFFPGGPHGASGNNPRYGALQVDFTQNLINYARDHGFGRIEVPAEDEAAWMAMIEKYRPYSSFDERGQYYGGNTPGKVKRFLLNPGGRPKLDEFMARAIDSGYQGFLG
ncbi:MAG: NAD(P)/FAD-dependent oxidoreductase [Streptosporangiaceae bacterium]|jgi:cation diffusion facilitator CzcD-associated flavoprotein CzcO